MRVKKIKVFAAFVICLLLVVAIVAGITFFYQDTEGVTGGNQMAHGQPDYGLYAPKTTVGSLADMGELAARLGSIVYYDRRGDVMFLEDFTNDLARWELLTPETGDAIVIDTTRYRSAGFSCKLTTGSTGNGGVQISRKMPVPALSGIGLEASFSLTGALGVLQFCMKLQTATHYHQFEAHYDVADGSLIYKDKGYAPVDVNLPAALEIDTGLFHTLKLVGDYSTKKYKRLLLDDFSIDLSDIACYSYENPDDPYFQITLVVFPDPVANRNYWLDDIIVTQNEP